MWAFGLMLEGTVLIECFNAAAAASGFCAAMMALTIATPSRVFVGALDWNMMRWTFDALIPPIATVGMAWSIDARRWRIFLAPAVPMIDFVFSLVAVE